MEKRLEGLAVAVFCASRDVAREYCELARATGAAVAQSGAQLIYGDGQRGLMGAVREGALAHGGHVIGVLPAFMQQWGWGSPATAEKIVTTSMHDRKAWMEAHADAFIVLPGGLGTLDELVTVMTTRQLNQHSKPIILLDPTDYYEPLMHLFQHMIRHAFIHSEVTPMPHRCTTPDEALNIIAEALGQQ